MLPAALKAALAAAPVDAVVMPPAFVYFDLGNVIATFDRERAFRRMAEVSGADVATVRTAVMGGLQQDWEAGAIDWSGFHAAFSRRTGTTSCPESLAAAAADMFELNVEILPVVAKLQRAGVPMGILSNTCDVHWRHLLARRWGVLPICFRERVLSYEVRAAKPDVAVFALATERAGVPPAAIFFCDDLPEHVAAARAAGWDAELYTSAAALAGQLGQRGVNL
ncbi:MAG: HAD family phosphatase, partial [Planctomycetes bacterium]|nr:HAD family phosphatase [Planctomycetota bacterium]